MPKQILVRETVFRDEELDTIDKVMYAPEYLYVTSNNMLYCKKMQTDTQFFNWDKITFDSVYVGKCKINLNTIKVYNGTKQVPITETHELISCTGGSTFIVDVAEDLIINYSNIIHRLPCTPYQPLFICNTCTMYMEAISEHYKNAPAIYGFDNHAVHHLIPCDIDNGSYISKKLFSLGKELNEAMLNMDFRYISDYGIVSEVRDNKVVDFILTPEKGWEFYMNCPSINPITIESKNYEKIMKDCFIADEFNTISKEQIYEILNINHSKKEKEMTNQNTEYSFICDKAIVEPFRETIKLEKTFKKFLEEYLDVKFSKNGKLQSKLYAKVNNNKKHDFTIGNYENGKEYELKLKVINEATNEMAYRITITNLLEDTFITIVDSHIVSKFIADNVFEFSEKVRIESMKKVAPKYKLGDIVYVYTENRYNPTDDLRDSKLFQYMTSEGIEQYIREELKDKLAKVGVICEIKADFSGNEPIYTYMVKELDKNGKTHLCRNEGIFISEKEAIDAYIKKFDR